MSNSMYQEELYKDFYGQLMPLLNGKNIQTVDMRYLEKAARPFARKSDSGSHVWSSKFSSRLAEKTVYLGSSKIQLPRLAESHIKIIKEAPDQLKKILHLVKTLPFVHIRRQMGDNKHFNPVCNFYISTADPKNVRLAYMWASTMFDPSARPGPEFTMIHIPEEHMLRAQILALPEYNLNIALGSDYLGEDKKGFLRQAMYKADELSMLGLHAGTKMVTVRDARENRLKKYGVFLFGMSATGKSTWSCHQLGLDERRGEETKVCQDDIVFLREDGSALGSENNFYVKTDVREDQQEAMYQALIHPSALIENVMLTADGKVEFLDESLCGNGRAVVFRKQLQVKRDGRLIGISADSVNLPPLEEMDGMIFAFITRRNTIMPFAQRLTPEQGVLAYLWGESSHSYASNPEKAGESVRIVGTDPFIVGQRGVKVNKFHDIIMKLVDRFGDKVRFMMYNTGGMGEIIETTQENGKMVKRMVRKTERVPLDLMAAIQRGDLRGTNTYEPGILGTESIVRVEGRSLEQYDVNKMYSPGQIEEYLTDLVRGRRAYTEIIAAEGLRPEIIRAAEKSFEIMPKVKPVIAGQHFKDAAQKTAVFPVEQSVKREKRPGVWRWR